MSLFTNTYSGLITKGLGLPAMCGLLTMDLGVFKCTISVVPPSGGGGGGGYAQFPVTDNGFYVPLSKKMSHGTKMVLVTVKFKDKSWRRSYVVDRYKGKIIINAINFVDIVRNSVSVGINTIKRTTKQVSAVFTRSDK